MTLLDKTFSAVLQRSPNKGGWTMLAFRDANCNTFSSTEAA